MKNVEPYTLSANLNEVSIYSIPCKYVKYPPNVTVIVKPITKSLFELFSKAWWANVTVTPDANNTAVFSRGIENGFRGQIPVGGQAQPISILGARLLWKNAQKNALKNMISEVINRIIPHSNPCCTLSVCIPQ